jgi:hypothetical protein
MREKACACCRIHSRIRSHIACSSSNHNVSTAATRHDADNYGDADNDDDNQVQKGAKGITREKVDDKDLLTLEIQ